MRLTTKQFYEVETELKEKTLFRDTPANELTAEDWEMAKAVIKADMLQIVGPEEMEALQIMMDEFVFSVLDPDAPYELGLATCRRLSKSTKYILMLLIMTIRIPWYNAGMTVKYQNRIIRSIVPSFKATLGIMRNSGWITPNEYVVLLSKINVSGFTFDGRIIAFASAETPDAALSIQATTDVLGYTGIFVHQIDDELIIEDFGTSDNVVLTDEEQMRRLDSITESFNRNLKAPFGKSFQRVRLFNTWDFTHKYFVNTIEKNIPASDKYKAKTTKELAEYNRAYLMEEELETDGILLAETTDEGGRAVRVGRISYKAIPAYRFDVEDYAAQKKADYNRWLPIYGAVPGKQINTDFTYPINPAKVEQTDNWRNTRISKVMIGLDRGKRDKTSLGIVAKEAKTGKWIFVGGVETSDHGNELQNSKMVMHNYLKQILRPNIGLLSSSMIVECDYHAYDFISSINEVAGRDIDSARVMINARPQPLYVIEPVKMSGFWSGIPNRVDLFNDKFLDNKIIVSTAKYTDLPEELTGLDILEKFEAVKDNPRDSSRDERPKKNDLDMVNAIEYAVSSDIG